MHKLKANVYLVKLCLVLGLLDRSQIDLRSRSWGRRRRDSDGAGHNHGSCQRGLNQRGGADGNLLNESGSGRLSKRDHWCGDAGVSSLERRIARLQLNVARLH